MKQKIEKAAHKTFGIVLAIAAIPALAAFVIVWLVMRSGGKAASLIARGNHENEKENYKNDF